MSKNNFIIRSCCIVALASVLNACDQQKSLASSELTAAQPTSAELYDQMDYQRATQAYIDVLPFVTMQDVHEAFLKVGAGTVNTIGVLSKPLASNVCVFTGNASVIYSINTFVFDGKPIVFEVPAGAVAGMFNNAWQQPIADMGIPAADKGKGGKYLLVPPHYEGELPEGYFIVKSDTNQILWLLRAFETPNQTKEQASALLRTIKLYELGTDPKTVEMEVVDYSTNPFDSCMKDESDYFAKLQRGMNLESGGRIQDKMLTSKLKTLGIEFGKDYSGDERMDAILARAMVTGKAMTKNMSFENRDEVGRQWEDRSYFRMITGLDARMENEDTIEIDRRAAYTYKAATLSDGMVVEMRNKGSKYLYTNKDASGATFNGSSSYSLHVDADTPAANFWELTVYDTVTRSMIANGTDVVGRSSNNDLAYNADGSVDLVMSPTKPANNSVNWIKTNPNEEFFIFFRVYSPTEAYYDGSWKLDEIVNTGK